MCRCTSERGAEHKLRDEPAILPGERLIGCARRGQPHQQSSAAKPARARDRFSSSTATTFLLVHDSAAGPQPHFRVNDADSRKILPRSYSFCPPVWSSRISENNMDSHLHSNR